MSKRRFAGISIAVAVGLALLIRLILAGYPVDWVGFGEITDPATGEVEREAKTLWDWLDLLIVSAVIALGGIWFNRQRSRTEDRIALDRQRENTLQKYFDDLTKLLLDHGLGTSEASPSVGNIAQARTVAALPRLNPQRQGMLVSFLRRSGLGGILNEANLRGANLAGADLRGANLSRAELYEVNLRGANLSGASLAGANLGDAKLVGAKLTGASLDGAKLIGADLTKADLHRTDLRGANLRRAELSKANLLEATYNDSTLWPDGFDAVAADARKMD